MTPLLRVPLLLLAVFLPSCSAQNGQTQTGQTGQTQTPSGTSVSSIPATPPASTPSDSRSSANRPSDSRSSANRPSDSRSSAPTRDPQSGLDYVNVAQLPREGQQLLTLIGKGGPFRYGKDGVTFGNREGVLPRQARGYYREYTVRTPGESDRGARRIVCGGQPVTNTAECYYTADHYASFRRIRP